MRTKPIATHNDAMSTVLVVDDEPIVRDVVVRYLRRDGFADARGGHRRGGDEAPRARAPSLVVLDVMLPGTDGLELCRRIRASSDLPYLLTARGDEADRIVGLELGADDYVTKPFSPRELAIRVRNLLRRASPVRAGPRTSQLRRGRASTAAAREVRRDGETLKTDVEGVRPALVPRLEPATRLLARPADGSRVGLHVRARHRHGDGAHPQAPREDRGRPSHPRHLETVWGVGYRFDAVTAFALITIPAVAGRRAPSSRSGFAGCRP